MAATSSLSLAHPPLRQPPPIAPPFSASATTYMRIPSSTTSQNFNPQLTTSFPPTAPLLLLLLAMLDLQKNKQTLSRWIALLFLGMLRLNPKMLRGQATRKTKKVKEEGSCLGRTNDSMQSRRGVTITCGFVMNLIIT